MDNGCLAYLDSLSEGHCNMYQRLAVLNCLKEIAGLQAGSGSLYLFIRPPGTGKTHTTVILIGALINHSVVGHFFKEASYPTVLSNPGATIRYSDNPSSARFLLTGNSSYAVDTIGRKILESIPLPSSRTFIPEMVRVARQNYKYIDLQHISLHARAM